ncbi:MAG: glycosyltransferase family 2 protein [Candidatus Micrarchaeaceae archaeon]
MLKEDLVSVIIPTWKRKEMVVRCINSVLNNTYKNIEIVVGEDPSENEAENAIKKMYKNYKKITYFKNKKMCYLSITVNKMLRLTSGKYIFLLNDDNVIDKKCIEELVSSMKKYSKAGIVGPVAFYYSHPKIIMHAGTIRSKFIRGFTSPHAGEEWHNQIKEGDVVDDFGNAFMFRREAMIKAGMWDLLIYAQGEDGDFEARVKKLGYIAIINPKAKTYHDIPYIPNSNVVSLFVLRVDPVRIYNAMHSKIIYEYRYEKTLQKITFALSFPLYYGYYVNAIIKTPNYKKLKDKLYLWHRLNLGILNGFKDVIISKTSIEYIEK